MGVVAGISAVAGVAVNIGAANQAQNAMDTAYAQQQQALDNQLATIQQQQALGQQQMALWDKVYGPIERNLSNYYQNLSPERLVTIGHQANAAQFQAMNKQLQASMAQRGISGSGVEGAAMMGLAAQQAMANAQVTQQAPERVAQAQQSFLARGDTLRAGGMNMQMQGLQGQAGIYGQQAAFANQQYAQAFGQQQQAYQGIGNVIGAGAQAIGYYGSQNGGQNQNQNFAPIPQGGPLAPAGGGAQSYNPAGNLLPPPQYIKY